MLAWRFSQLDYRPKDGALIHKSRREHFSSHTCFINRFKVLKGLKTFDLILASAHIKGQDKKDIQEEMREALIEDYKRPKALKKSKAKRAASTDVVTGSRRTTKKAKKASTSVSIGISHTPYR